MEKNRGAAAVGIEDPTGALGTFSIASTRRRKACEIPDSTAITFSVSPLSSISVTSQNLQGCKPLTSCYTAKITVTPPPCAG